MRHGSILRSDEVHPISDHGRREQREERKRRHGHFLVCDVVVVGVQALEGCSRRRAVEGCLWVAAAPFLLRESRRGAESMWRSGDRVLERGRTVRNLAQTWGGRWLPMGLGKGAETASGRKRELIHAGQVLS